MKKYRLIAVLIIIVLVGAVFTSYQDNIRWTHTAVDFAVERGYLEKDVNQSDIMTARDISSALLKYADINYDDFFEQVKSKYPLVIENAESLDRQITDEMAAYMITKTMSDCGSMEISDAVTISTAYNDYDEKYLLYADTAINAGIFAGGAGLFAPKTMLTFERFAVLLNRVYAIEHPMKSFLNRLTLPLLSVAAAAVCYYAFVVKKKGLRFIDKYSFVSIVAIAFLVRLVIGEKYFGNTDMNYWINWSEALCNNGLYGIYDVTSIDYPPGYLYILYVLGLVSKKFTLGHVFYKLPPILFDILFVVFAHAAVKKYIKNQGELFTVDILAAFSAPLIINSAMWGQVDIVYLFWIVLFIWLVMENRMKESYVMYAAAILFKPQALVFAPVLLFALFEKVLKTKDFKTIAENLCCGIGAVLLLCVSFVPFGLTDVISQYVDTLASYPCFTLNAFNIYAVFNLNFCALPEWYTYVNTLIIAGIVVYSAVCFIKGNRNYYFLAAMIAYAFFMLSAKMHERYCFPAVVLFLMAYIYENSKENMYCFLGASFTYVLNVVSIFFLEGTIWVSNGVFIGVCGGLNVMILIYVLAYGLKNKVCIVAKERIEV